MRAADAVAAKFDALFQLLADQPQMGERQDRYRESMRSFANGNYVLFYEPIKGGIRLLRILHGARRFEGLF